MKKSDWIGILALILIVIGGGIVIYHFIIVEINSCTSDSLKYTVDKVVDSNFSYNYAELKIYADKYDIVPIANRVLDLTEK